MNRPFAFQASFRTTCQSPLINDLDATHMTCGCSIIDYAKRQPGFDESCMGCHFESGSLVDALFLRFSWCPTVLNRRFHPIEAPLLHYDVRMSSSLTPSAEIASSKRVVVVTKWTAVCQMSSNFFSRSISCRMSYSKPAHTLSCSMEGG